MRKLLFIMAMCVISATHAEINPVSRGAYKTEHVGGVTDQYVKLNYATDGSYYAFSLKCASRYNPMTFSLVLGHSPEEALRSVDALLSILDEGDKNESYTIDEETVAVRKSKNMVYISRTGYADPGYLERRHLNNAREFIQMALPQ
ncbi:MAG: hypothetical protein IKP39_01085 [Paludibacteraceae bacterium]|nr:hypothetical protein [Paludibacteraceae bacterium]